MRLVKLIILILALNSCDGFNFGYEIAEVENFVPLGEVQNVKFIHNYSHSRVIAFDPENEEVLASYTFPQRIPFEIIPNPQGGGFYIDLRPGAFHYVNSETGEVTKLNGYKYPGQFMGLNVTSKVVYLYGQDVLGEELYARTIEMPDHKLGESFLMPYIWTHTGNNKSIKTSDDTIFSVSVDGNTAGLYNKDTKKLTTNILSSYFDYAEDLSSLRFFSAKLASVVYIGRDSDLVDTDFLFKINSVEPFDLILIYSGRFSFSHLFDTDDGYIIFTNEDNPDMSHMVLKISYNGEKLGSFGIDEYDNYTVVEWNSCYYTISSAGDKILKVDKDLNTKVIPIDLDSL